MSEDNMTKEIRLTNGLSALIDDDDFVRVSQHRWYHTNGYATAHIRVNGRLKTVYLHRFVFGADAENIDHLNRNKLDCRKCNLRGATRSQNNMNCGRRERNTSGYKGVHQSAKSGTWIAQINYQGQKHYIGSYTTAIEAARAYDREARRLYGEYAAVNFEHP